MEKDELVSIVIPVYNSQQFLEECLNSVLSQTYDNIEIIAIDDGSTDSSSEILKKFSDKIEIFTQKNSGLTSALNLGITKMKGKWFKWFSPDDLMFPNTIETLINEAKNFPKNTIVYSNWYIVDELGNILREFKESNYNDLSNFDYTVRLLDGQQINVNTSIIPSTLLRKNSFRTLDDPVAIDYDFFLNASLHFHVNFRLVSKPLIKYRIHSTQLSHKNISKTLSFVSKIKEELLSNVDDELRNNYLIKLKQYQKSKSSKRKTMELGMKFLSISPSNISDTILTFYLNKIRHSR